MQQGVPFFTNDWPGIIKVIVVLVTVVVLPVITFIWKVMQGPLQREDERLATSLNGLGGRTDAAEKWLERHGAEIGELRRRADKADTDVVYLRERFTEVRAAVETLREQSQVNKTEIIEAFQRRTQELQDTLHAMDREVVKVQTTLELVLRREAERERDADERPRRRGVT